MKVSVITICLNGAAHLAEALQSVAGQEHTDLEHLVIDGGSTDGSLDIIRDFARDNPRLRWWSGPDNGISDAMNRGLALASGNVIAFLHADDRYHDAAVLTEVVRGFRAEPRSLWLTGGIREIDTVGNALRDLPVRAFSYRRLLRNNIIYHPATFVRRESFEKLGGFDTSLRLAMDYDFWLRLGRICKPVERQRVLAEFRVHEGSLSSRERRAVIDEEYRIRCRYIEDRLARLGHSMYQVWRRWRV